jgi:hypothetical protein
MSVRVVDFRFFPSKIKCIENPLGPKKVVDAIFFIALRRIEIELTLWSR